MFGKYWQKDDESLPNHIAPEGWIELWPHTPLLADTFVNGAELQQELLDELINHIDFSKFEQRLPQLERVDVLTHHIQKYQAWIYKHQEAGMKFSFTRGLLDAVVAGYLPGRTFALFCRHRIRSGSGSYRDGAAQQSPQIKTAFAINFGKTPYVEFQARS